MKLSKEKVNALLIKRASLNSQIKELEEQVKECEDVIKTYMEEQDKEELFTSLFHVTYQEEITHRFDKKNFIKQYGEDIYNKYQIEGMRTPFHVYPIKK